MIGFHWRPPTSMPRSDVRNIENEQLTCGVNSFMIAMFCSAVKPLIMIPAVMT